jgi:hypothetical protein
MSHKFRLPVLGVLFTTIIFLLGLSVFFTNDDFFFLKISLVNSPVDIINFFNPTKGPEGFGVYRPLTTQAYYAVSRNLFHSSPVVLRSLSFAGLLSISFLVYRLSQRLTGSAKAAGISVFIYLISVTHYAHLFYSASFQEIGFTFFSLLGCLALWRKPYYSVLCFFLALLSKETAITYPLLIPLLYYFNSDVRSKVGNLKQLFSLVGIHFIVLAVYAYFRFYFYGFATGDSYIWEFSPKIINTVGWYLLWSFNLPEMWVDFIGPGLHVNPNLFKFWGRETVLIFSLFLIFLLPLLVAFKKSKLRLTIFSGFWFLITLGPLLFLPWHKFSFYLTLPLVVISILVGELLANHKYKNLLLITWVLLTVSSFLLTHKTNWISRGAEVSRRVHEYLVSREASQIPWQQIVFYDSPADSVLPWAPSAVVKVALSDNNYFQVFWPELSAVYLSEKPAKISFGQILVPARQFLGY